jgi:hypothetical protein
MLSDNDVSDILIASGHSQRQRKRKLCGMQTSWYANSLRKQAENVLDEWVKNGVPVKSWAAIRSKPVVKLFGLNLISSPPSTSTCVNNNAESLRNPYQPVIITQHM